MEIKTKSFTVGKKNIMISLPPYKGNLIKDYEELIYYFLGEKNFSDVALLGTAFDREDLDLLRNLRAHFNSGENEKFMALIYEEIMNSLALVIQMQPELLPSDATGIVLEIIKLGRAHGTYRKDENGNLIIGLNASYLISEILSGKRKFMSTLSHELMHSYDNFLDESHEIAERIGGKSKSYIGSGKYWVYRLSVIIFRFFAILRTEGLPRFYQQFQHESIINVNPVFLEQFKKVIFLMADIQNPNEITRIEKNFNKIKFHGVACEAGSAMISVIIIYRLLSSGQGFSAWIKEGLLHREMNADRILEFWPNKNFTLRFSEESAKRLVFEMIKNISAVSHLSFFKEYETACAYLKIDPLISIEFYNICKKKIWSNISSFEAHEAREVERMFQYANKPDIKPGKIIAKKKGRK